MEPVTDNRISYLIGLIYEASRGRSADAWTAVYRGIDETVASGILALRIVDDERLELSAAIENPERAGTVRISIGTAADRDGHREKQPAGSFHRFEVNETNLNGEVSVSVQSPAKDRESSDRSIFETLAPHLLRSFKIFCGLAEIETERRTISASLEGVSQGVIALDADGKALYLNGLAGRIIDGRDCLRLDREGRLRAVSKNDDENLRTILRTVLEDDFGTAPGYRGAMRISRPGGGRPISVVIAAFSETDAFVPRGGAVILLFVNDPERRFDGLEPVLSAVYSLTPAEARLTVLLARGETLRRACELLGVTENTARTHLKRVFSKTETDRQSELVRIVQNYSGSIALPGGRR